MDGRVQIYETNIYSYILVIGVDSPYKEGPDKWKLDEGDMELYVRQGWGAAAPPGPAGHLLTPSYGSWAAPFNRKLSVNFFILSGLKSSEYIPD